ncbi:Cytochrome p450 [Thalictrum thalictroides]|uniref:Cytochrome p450 n=1 Tax=Thalictrum thalictroides TaxID=46969 RepID=A0A7J6WZ23_THATH|nr:Cytochrome p450 [Thalictrum thalictroides]
MFLAGSDTASAAVVWAMTELIRHPEIMKELQKEIREIGKENLGITEDDLGKMHYLKLVMKETLRLHGPAPLLLPHESIQDTKLLGYDIPAKTKVLVNAWAIAMDPLLWDEPDEFRPRRFLNSSLDYKGNNFEYIPFGTGRRKCPGISFAILTMELPLANLLYHFDWTMPNGAPKPEDLDITEGFGIVTYKKDPLVVVATPHI